MKRHHWTAGLLVMLAIAVMMAWTATANEAEEPAVDMQANSIGNNTIAEIGSMIQTANANQVNRSSTWALCNETTEVSYITTDRDLAGSVMMLHDMQTQINEMVNTSTAGTEFALHPTLAVTPRSYGHIQKAPTLDGTLEVAYSVIELDDILALMILDGSFDDTWNVAQHQCPEAENGWYGVDGTLLL